MRNYSDFLDGILISEEDLQKRIAELGRQISGDYQDQDLLLVCILRGGILFLADLMRHISVPHTLDFMAVSSYSIGARETSGKARITLDINTDIHGRNVLLIEDIVDSGYTLKAVLDFLSTRRPKSLHVCVLLDKAERREVNVPLRYVGFKIPNKFVFGYGLDIDEYYRNLRFIGSVSEDKYRQME